MSKGKRAAWVPLPQGIGLALGMDLLAQPLLALLAVKGVLGEEQMFPAVAAACALATLAGALYCAARCPWGTLVSGLGCGAGVAAVLAALGLLCWQQVDWTGRGGVVLLCALGAGLLGGLLGRKGGRRVRKRPRHK